MDVYGRLTKDIEKELASVFGRKQEASLQKTGMSLKIRSWIRPAGSKPYA